MSNSGGIRPEAELDSWQLEQEADFRRREAEQYLRLANEYYNREGRAVQIIDKYPSRSEQSRIRNECRSGQGSYSMSSDPDADRDSRRNDSMANSPSSSQRFSQIEEM